MDSVIFFVVLAAALGLRLWAGMAWADFVDAMPEEQRRAYLRHMSRAGY